MPWLTEKEIYSALLQGDKAALLALLQNNVDFSGDYFYFEPLLIELQGDHETALQMAIELEKASIWPVVGLLLFYEELGDVDRMRSLVSRIDALKVGPTILAIDLTIRGRILRFDLNDTPRLKKRLEEAKIDPASFTEKRDSDPKW